MVNTRLINEAVVIFLKKEDKYLLLKRRDDHPVDPGIYNGIGGRVQLGETYLDTAIRMIKEETGYEIVGTKLKFVGLAREEECEHGDWTMAYYTANVAGDPPLGWKTPKGELFWVEELEVLNKDIISDLKYIFPEIIKNSGIFFACWKRKNTLDKIHDFRLLHSN